MSEEQTRPTSPGDRIRRASSPSSADIRCSTKDWLESNWTESAYLTESIKRDSPDHSPKETINVDETDSVHEAPLDFSMKKRKSTSGAETRISVSDADQSYGITKAFLERRASSPNFRRDSDPDWTAALGPSFCSPNRRRSSSLLHGPSLSLATAAAAAVVNCNTQQNVGAATTKGHYLTQQLLQRRDQGMEQFSENGGDGPDPASALGSTPSTPPAFSAGVSPTNGHQQAAVVSNRYAQQKIQRPFKAYNPMDPMSALQVGASLAPSALPFLNAALATPTMSGSIPSPHSMLSNQPNLQSPFLNAQLISQYRQYLINAQAAAALSALRAKSSQHAQQQLTSPFPRASQATVGQLGANCSSQSPPEVTSTSHPHTAEVPSSNGAHHSPNNASAPNATASSAGSTGRIIQTNQSACGPDRRISSGSGSGGSSFNGADEDDEDLHEDEDGASARTSPAPSCASSTRRASLATGHCVTMCLGNGGGSAKAENGSNGGTGRRKGRSLPDALKDEAYWERRRKNNEAAKRSRDARRAKEDEIAIRAALLEQENMRLRIELAALKAETEKLRQMLLNT